MTHDETTCLTCASAARARRALEFAAVCADWLRLREVWGDTPVVIVVLDLHRPEPNRTEPTTCGSCGTPWPCVTYLALYEHKERT